MNIGELKELGEKWANLPAGTEADNIADEVMDKLPELLEQLEKSEKACAEMRSCIEDFGIWNSDMTGFLLTPDRIDHALSTSCGSDYIHRDEVRPLVEALKLTLKYIPAVHATGYIHEARYATEQALAHAENLLKGEKE